MIDIKRIRDCKEEVEAALRKRDSRICLDEVIELDKQYRDATVKADELKNLRNVVSKEIAGIKDDAEREAKKAEMKAVSDQIASCDNVIRELKERIDSIIIRLPNIPHESVPVSDNEDDKIIVRSFGEKPELFPDFKNHVDLGKSLGIFDFERATKISQSMFSMYVGDGALLEWALIRYMMDTLTSEKGFTLVIPPFIVNEKTLFTAGTLPKFGDQVYKCKDDDLYLIPTSEVSIASVHRDEILDEEVLPLMYCAYSPCFRREAGAYGKGERGLIRVHQFNKVEMFKYVTAETSYDELESMVSVAESLVTGLGIHCRTALLVTSDISQQSCKTYDIEVWLPGQERYYEVSSCSNCEDYQARRGNIRYRGKDDKKTKLVHTLNGSGLATSRLMVALIESNQQPDGSVVIPEVLRKYLGGREKLTPKQ